MVYPNEQLIGGPLWANGPSPATFYNFPGGNRASSQNSVNTEFAAPGLYGTQRSYYPVCTGTSVVALKFEGGVVIAADKLVSYGSLARFHDIERVFKINDKTILGFGGDYADFQYIKKMIDQKVIDDICLDDKQEMKPKELYSWLTRVMYNRRNKFEPLYLDMVVGGMQDGESFLGHINLRGRSYTSNVVATGYGSHLGLPLLREYSEKPDMKISQEKAIELTKSVMEVLWYRDCRSDPKYAQVICTAEGVKEELNLYARQNWELARMIKGY